MAFELAVYASQCRLPEAPRKTRFRLLAELYRVAFRHWVPAKGFRSLGHDRPPPFPSFAWRNFF
jgi:hypothetical protein